MANGADHNQLGSDPSCLVDEALALRRFEMAVEVTREHSVE